MLVVNNKPVSFDLPVYGSNSEYFRVLIFPDKDMMLLYSSFIAENLGTKPAYQEPNGITWLYPAETEGDLKGNRGQVLLNKEMTGHGIVEHELGHVALYLCDYKVIRDDDEETFCNTLMHLCYSFWDAYFKHIEEINAL